MKIAFKNGDGIVITNDGNLPERYLVWTDELQIKYDSFIKAVINEDYTDIIEGATEEEIKTYTEEQIKILNKNQYDELQPYDWYFTRFIRKGVEVPKEIIDITNNIDEKYKKLKEKYKKTWNKETTREINGYISKGNTTFFTY